MKSICIFLMLLMGICPVLFAQNAGISPAYNHCDQAQKINPGETIYGYNTNCDTTTGETPLRAPYDCIQTFQNDIWLSFTAEEAYAYYAVSVELISCQTSKGLQVLILESASCDAKELRSVSCVKHTGRKDIELYLMDPIPGQHYFIYIDGDAGNGCVFSLSFQGYETLPLSQPQNREIQNVYKEPEPPFYEPEQVSIEFRNNKTFLEWEANSREPVSLFFVERILEKEGYLGPLLEVFLPRNAVIEKLTPYSFTDIYSQFENGESYCYRIVKIDKDGTTMYSEPICITAKVLESFSVAPVIPPNDDSQIYSIHIINKKKQDLVLTVFDVENANLKGTVLKKEPIGSRLMELDMKGYEPGLYRLKVESKEGAFVHEFVVR